MASAQYCLPFFLSIFIPQWVRRQLKGNIISTFVILKQGQANVQNLVESIAISGLPAQPCGYLVDRVLTKVHYYVRTKRKKEIKGGRTCSDVVECLCAKMTSKEPSLSGHRVRERWLFQSACEAPRLWIYGYSEYRSSSVLHSKKKKKLVI